MHFLLVILAVLCIRLSCDFGPAPNDNQCNYQGLTFNDTIGSIITLITKPDLQKDYFLNTDEPGKAAVEV